MEKNGEIRINPEMLNWWMDRTYPKIYIHHKGETIEFPLKSPPPNGVRVEMVCRECSRYRYPKDIDMGGYDGTEETPPWSVFLACLPSTIKYHKDCSFEITFIYKDEMLWVSHFI